MYLLKEIRLNKTHLRNYNKVYTENFECYRCKSLICTGFKYCPGCGGKVNFVDYNTDLEYEIIELKKVFEELKSKNSTDYGVNFDKEVYAKKKIIIEKIKRLKLKIVKGENYER